MKALVTGASRGIGRAVANALLAADAHVALAVRDLASVAQLTASAKAIALGVDLRRADQTEVLVERAVSALGGLDVLVNCAGIVHYNPLGQVSRAELMEQLEVNFVAPFLLGQRAAVHMRSAGAGGAIVNVASTLGLRAAAQTAAYAASKAALISLTESLALEFGRDRVRVNAVAPGVIDTDMVRVARPGPDSSAQATASTLEAQLAELRELHLMRRLGTPEEVAEAVLYLLRAEFVTGTVLVVDGGLLLG